VSERLLPARLREMDVEVVPSRDRQLVAEYRDPRGATQRTQWTSPTMPMVPEWDAEQAWRLGVLANVIAYRCVQILAGNASTPPLVAGRNPRKPRDINESARITQLLGPPPGGPAPKLSARKLLRWTIAQQIVTGRRAWEIETADPNDDKARPVALWPLVPAQLRAVPSTGGNEWFRIFAYGRNEAPVTFRPDQVFYGWDPGGNDFRQPESVLQSARYDLSLVTLCDRYGMAFLRNNAVPASVITTTAFPNDTLRENFRRQWRAEFGGVDNAGRTAFHEVDDEGDGPVGESIDIKVLGLSAKDSKLIEQRKEAMAEVAISLGVPWSKLDASGRTFDNAEVEDRTMWEERLLPLMTDLVDDINMQLAPRFGPEVVWFDLSDVRALQRKVMPVTQTVGAPALLFAQVMKINEARADYGLGPLADGDRVLTPDEIAALQGGGASAGGEAMRTALVELEARMTAALESRTAGDDDPPSPLPVVENRAVDPAETERRRARIWRSNDAVATALEARWERQWRRMFARQAEATMTRLKGKRGRQMLDEARAPDPAPQIDPAAIFDAAFWATETRAMLEGLYEETALAGLNRLSASFGVSFDLSAPYVTDFIEARANQLAGPVTETTYEAIRLQLQEGVMAGEPIDDIAARIRAVFANCTDTRATTIARTEVVSAYNGASALGAAQLPADVVAGQEWIATRDSRARPAHAAADGQVRSIGEPFEVGGATLAYPGDPSAGPKNTVNCRCTIAYLTPEEMAGIERTAHLKLEHRTAQAMVLAVRTGDEHFDFIGYRRALQEVAA